MKSSVGAIGLPGQAGMVLRLVLFLLLGGDTRKRKFVRLAGPTLSKRKCDDGQRRRSCRRGEKVAKSGRDRQGRPRR